MLITDQKVISLKVEQDKEFRDSFNRYATKRELLDDDISVKTIVESLLADADRKYKPDEKLIAENDNLKKQVKDLQAEIEEKTKNSAKMLEYSKEQVLKVTEFEKETAGLTAKLKDTESQLLNSKQIITGLESDLGLTKSKVAEITGLDLVAYLARRGAITFGEVRTCGFLPILGAEKSWRKGKLKFELQTKGLRNLKDSDSVKITVLK